MLRLLTLNLHGDRHAPWDARRSRIAGLLRDTTPDIVALQAVIRAPEHQGGLDRATELARHAGIYEGVVYHAVTRHPDGSEDGLALLSRHPAIQVTAHPLTRRDDTDDPSQRALLHGLFATRFGPLHVFGAHFSWAEPQALDNLTQCLPRVLAEPQVVLLGDLGQTPDSTTAARLRAAGLVDAWTALHPDDPTMSDRVEYAWLGPAIAPRLVEARVVRPGQTRRDDHAGLLVTLDASDPS